MLKSKEQSLEIEDRPDMYLRAPCPDDLAAIQRLIEDNIDFITQYSYGWPDTSSAGIGQKVGRLMDKIDEGEIIEYLICEQDGEIVGMADFHEMNPATNSAYLGYMVAEDQTGEGFPKAAAKRLVDYGFNELGYQKILLEIDPNNAASINIAESLGATKVGEVYMVEENGRQFPNQRWEIARGHD